MKVIALRGENRTDMGKAANKALRRQGKVPCVSYGNGDEPSHFAVYEGDFKNLVYTPNTYLVMLNLDGQQKLCKLQDIQFHPVSESIIHADFYEINTKEPVSVAVPINIVGVAPGVRAGGKLQIKMQKLRVRGKVEDLPDSIDVNIDALEIGKGVRVNEISVDGVELLDTPENTIVSCNVTRAARSAQTAEEGEEAEGEEGTSEEESSEE
jgi:large subunit ribosomal protein L25